MVLPSVVLPQPDLPTRRSFSPFLDRNKYLNCLNARSFHSFDRQYFLRFLISRSIFFIIIIHCSFPPCSLTVPVHKASMQNGGFPPTSTYGGAFLRQIFIAAFASRCELGILPVGSAYPPVNLRWGSAVHSFLPALTRHGAKKSHGIWISRFGRKYRPPDLALPILPGIYITAPW